MKKNFSLSCEEDYLAYGDPKNENIHIINLETKRTQLIQLKPKPDLSRSPTLSIQETKIQKNVFYIKYESVDINDEIITIEKTFEIEI